MSRKASTLVVFLLSAAAGVAVWAGLRFTAPNFLRSISSTVTAPVDSRSTTELWEQAIAKVKEARVEVAGAAPLEVPPELRHYSERRWFLATQVAEVRKHNLVTSRDFLDLATKVKNGDLVGVPAVTDTYVLFGVGQIANDGAFARHENDRNVELYNEHQLREEFARVDTVRASLATEISSLNKQIAGLNRRDKTRRSELQKQLATQQAQLRSNDEHKKQLHELYGQPASRERLFRDYESLQTLAKDFRGRTFDLEKPADRQALKVTLLSSLRPQAFKLMQEIAAAYHGQFDRPLPVSSLVRPEQYQDSLRRVNRSATVIETPPHSTGLAFDIDYRYMSATEQNFVMTELARMKQAGRIEVLRERAANIHVFVFIDGTRPSDELVTAALEDVGPSLKEADKEEVAAKANTKKARQPRAKATRAKPKARRRR
ncbi:MAG: DUF5715 family protein [Acidobacteriota bacterium]